MSGVAPLPGDDIGVLCGLGVAFVKARAGGAQRTANRCARPSASDFVTGRGGASWHLVTHAWGCMDALAAAAAAVAMDADEFAEEDVEQYAPHDAAATGTERHDSSADGLGRNG